MTLFKLKAATTILIEDDYNRNCLPLLLELVQDHNTVKIYCLEQPSAWQGIFANTPYLCYQDLPEQYEKSKDKTAVIIESVNQMALLLGWNKCLKRLREFQLDPNVSKLVLILHKDCIVLNSKLQIHLNHIAHATVSFDSKLGSKLNIQIKKAGKFLRSEETLAFDIKTNCLLLTPIVKLSKKDEVETISPANLSTFKIETDQISQLEKNKLVLPYMSKIHEGQGRVFYEPDAVDDWDDEDPDDDLDI